MIRHFNIQGKAFAMHTNEFKKDKTDIYFQE